MSAGSPQISQAITTPKINTGLSVNVYSDRFQNHAHNVCPIHTHHDLYGRPGHAYSIDMLTAGCHDPQLRITVENALRPSTHPYLNTDGLEGDSYSYASSLQGYDTMLGGKVPGRDSGFGFNAAYQVPQTDYASMYAHDQEVKQRNRAVQRKFESQRFKSSGMY